MSFVQNFPCFSIVICMAAGILSTPMNGKNAKRTTLAVVSLVMVMSIAVFIYTLGTGTSFVYTMGKYPAPWGNEIRAGVLECFLATVFSMVMLFSLIGGMDHVFKDVKEEKINLYFILVDLLLSSLLAIIYTNDLFTGYVFVEINTIAACGMIMIRGSGRSLLAAAINALSPREKQIITLRFGLDGQPERTQKEVADMLGISQSYISRLEKRIIARLKREILKLA